MSFVFVYNEDFARKGKCTKYKPEFESYEHPLRVKSIMNYLHQRGILERKDVRIIDPEHLSPKDILYLHSPFLLENVKRKSEDVFGELGYLVCSNQDTYELSMKSAGAVVKLAKLITNIEKCENLERVTAVFSLNRPPGHHAYKEVSEGLCVFNNLALAIKILREKYHYKGKIAILDIDDHFGNGISSIFYDDPSVLYISLHEFDFDIEDSGSYSDIGAGAGRGYNINFPLPINCTGKYYLEALKTAMKICEQFQPDVIFVETGLDSHYSDPLGNLCLIEADYLEIGKIIKTFTEKHTDERVGFVLEGGYNPLILGRLVEKLIAPFLKEYTPEPPIDSPIPILFEKHEEKEIRESFQAMMMQVRSALSFKWQF
jgi:acetoin utilization deacetylase AcuC-like enzyme